jgi:hypothetical protein
MGFVVSEPVLHLELQFPSKWKEESVERKLVTEESTPVGFVVTTET